MTTLYPIVQGNPYPQRIQTVDRVHLIKSLCVGNGGTLSVGNLENLSNGSINYVDINFALNNDIAYTLQVRSSGSNIANGYIILFFNGTDFEQIEIPIREKKIIIQCATITDKDQLRVQNLTDSILSISWRIIRLNNLIPIKRA